MRGDKRMRMLNLILAATFEPSEYNAEYRKELR